MPLRLVALALLLHTAALPALQQHRRRCEFTWAGLEWDCCSSHTSCEGLQLRGGHLQQVIEVSGAVSAVVNGSGGNHFAPDDDGGAEISIEFLHSPALGAFAGLELYSAGVGKQSYTVGVCGGRCMYDNGTAAPSDSRVVELRFTESNGSSSLLYPEVLLAHSTEPTLLTVFVGADGPGFRTFGVEVDHSVVLLYTDLRPSIHSCAADDRCAGLGVGLFQRYPSAQKVVNTRLSQFSFVGS
jgi:hypothetical protein